MAGEISREQLMSHEFIIGVFQRFKSPTSLLQRFYGVGLGSAGTKRVLGRDFGYDYFDPTRSLAQGRAPMLGPATTSRKPEGHGTGMCYRSHEKVPIPVEELNRTRGLGRSVGTIDPNGVMYFAAQAKYLADRFTNAREFALAHMFRGGVGVTVDGETMNLTTKGNGTFDMNSLIPTSHLDKLEMGSGADIMSGAWQTNTTDIPAELINLEAAFEREVGMAARHVWINGVTFQYLLDNTPLQNLAGTAVRTFESLTDRELPGIPAGRDTGYDVVFRGLPQYTFHVYNGVLHAGSGEDIGYPDTISSTNSIKIIPDDYALITPEPSSEWLGLCLGSEPVQEARHKGIQTRYGFHAWMTPEIDPPVMELKGLDNFMYYFPMPRAVAWAHVANN